MRRISREEFEDRLRAVQTARRIFVESGLTKNISIAFQVYQEIFAETERDLVISTATHGRRLPTEFDHYPRPVCPDCGETLLFRGVPKNARDIQTQLVCSSRNCKLALNSVMILPGWLNLVKTKSAEYIAEEVKDLERVEKKDPLPGMTGQKSETICPECGKGKMDQIKACCGAPNGYLWCSLCRAEIILD